MSLKHLLAFVRIISRWEVDPLLILVGLFTSSEKLNCLHRLEIKETLSAQG